MSKFCKVCFDSKKSESVFTSHNVRERGRVVCPTLLTIVCNCCGETGHTPKFCKKMKSRNLNTGLTKNARKRYYYETRKPIKKKTNSNYDNWSDSDEESEETKTCFGETTKIPWGEGPGEDLPFQPELLERIQSGAINK